MGFFSFCSNFRLRSHLSYRILAYILICSALFTFICTAVQLYVEYQKDIRSIEDGLTQIREGYLHSIAQSLWNINVSQLNLELQSALLLPDIQYLEVSAANGSKKNTFAVAGSPKKEGVRRYQFPLVYRIRQKKLPIGNLTLMVNLEGVHRRLYNRILFIVVTQAIKTFLWAFCVIVLFQYVIMRHLNAIAGYLKQVDISRLNMPLTLNRKISVSDHPDELERIQMAINSMRENLIQSVAERRQAEEALRRLNAELDQRVLDRTAQLEAANKELEGFTYSVSHDLRAPLRHIDGFMEMLEKKTEGTLGEQARHYMNAISGAAQKMGQLVDDLLAFSRMKRYAVTAQPVDLGGLVRNIIGELEPDIADRNVDWHIGELPEVRGDATMLRVVLLNLMSNALKFTRSRQQARIEIGSKPGREAETVIYVHDNGVGFDMTYADKLFGVFQRLHRTEDFEGTGIGLANVRRIITKHGGRTWAEGKPDQGAVFYFTLP